MAGRAGRRGYDDVGTVIILAWDKIPDLNSILFGKPVELTSQYRLTYQTILSILLLSHHDNQFSVTNLLRGSFGEHEVTMNIKQIQYSQQVLLKSKSIYKRLVKLSKLKHSEIKILDDFYQEMQTVIPFMEYVHCNTLSSLNGKLRRKLLSNNRIILVTPEEAYLFPEIMVVVDFEKDSMRCFYLKDYLILCAHIYS